MIFDNEQIKIFDFYSVASYNSGVHVLNYGNNDTQILLWVSYLSKKHIKLEQAFKNSNNNIK